MRKKIIIATMSAILAICLMSACGKQKEVVAPESTVEESIVVSEESAPVEESTEWQTVNLPINEAELEVQNIFTRAARSIQESLTPEMFNAYRNTVVGGVDYKYTAKDDSGNTREVTVYTNEKGVIDNIEITKLENPIAVDQEVVEEDSNKFESEIQKEKEEEVVKEEASVEENTAESKVEEPVKAEESADTTQSTTVTSQPATIEGALIEAYGSKENAIQAYATDGMVCDISENTISFSYKYPETISDKAERDQMADEIMAAYLNAETEYIDDIKKTELETGVAGLKYVIKYDDNDNNNIVTVTITNNGVQE